MIDPYKKFNTWFNKAKKDFNGDHTAFALGTCDKNSQPHVRMVLLKKILKDGYVFFTNLGSNKGIHFENNKKLSMCFYWENLNRQIRVVGKGELLDSKKSTEYFQSRPRGSQIGAWASEQSSSLESRSILEERFHHFSKKYPQEVPRPQPISATFAPALSLSSTPSIAGIHSSNK